MFPGLVTRPLRAALVVVVVAVVVAGILIWRDATSSEGVSEDDAVGTFRDAGGAAGPGSPGVPRPGVYTFRQSGSERGGVGPAGITRSLPDRARYVVTLVEGGYHEELDLSEEHIEATRLRVGPEATREVARRTDVSFLGVGRDDRRTLRPPPVRLKRPLRAGSTWSGRYALGDLPARLSGRVLRADVVALDGVRRPVRVIRLVAETGGVHPATRTETIWWSPALALPLRWIIDTRVGGPVTLRTRAELLLESAEPRT